MEFSFDEFLLMTKEAVDSGIMKLSEPLCLLGLAMTYAVGLLGEQKGYPFDFTNDDIHRVMMTFTDESIYDKTEPIIGIPKGEIS